MANLRDWCRRKLSQSDEHPLIYVGAFHIILSAMKNAALSIQSQKEVIIETILSKNSKQGFRHLLSDIGKCLNGQDLPTDGVIHGISLAEQALSLTRPVLDVIYMLDSYGKAMIRCTLIKTCLCSVSFNDRRSFASVNQ
jgi:hypothetical protein